MLSGLKTIAAAALTFALCTSGVQAQNTVKIGAVYPLSGNAASAGASAKAAIETAVDIINQAHPELGDLTLAKDAGLPNLKGAKVEVIFADNQGTPAAGQNQALRLITEEKVHALIGSYQSGITLTASAVAEKYGIPFLSPESVAANLTERGFKWFFRTTPIASDIAAIYMDFLKDMKASGTKVDSIAIVNENTEYGTSIAKVIREAAQNAKINVGIEIPYNANTTDVQAQVLQLKDKNPDCVIFVSYTSDAMLYVKTMQALGYKPPIVIGDNSGFSDAAFLKNVGNIAQGAINRSAWDIGKPGSVTDKINEMYKKRTGYDLDDSAGRAMQGFFTLIDAINRAGSTEPDKIQAALKATDLKPNQLMMGYKGVKFDEKGNNIMASALLIQVQGDKYVAVWPKATATAPLQLPYKGW
ncbi:MAG: branched-chain amino acid ABC transporter substrate-binding protein [Methylocystaceae bacterium]|nr:branched-chain amino acid ABC transporter substrate-binding protein [Methylocystaceae bacterium]